MLASELEAVFHDCFYENFNTVLKGGFDEPLYLPARDGCSAEIRYRADFFASALHEIAHWCVAGPERLLQQDYGYWYSSKRDVEQQKHFEKVELMPQALESLFSVVCNYPFKVSSDNLDIPEYDCREFAQAVNLKAYEMQQGKTAIPKRAELFMQALKAYQ